MKQNFFFVFALSGLLFIAACAGTSTKATTENIAGSAAQLADDGKDAPRISLADAKKDYDAGAMFVDVRDVNAYKNEHIKGALNIPISEVAANEDKLPKGKKIIVYCS